MTVNCWW